MPLEIHLFAYLSDNYGVLLHDPASGETVAVDAGDGDAYLAALKEKGWTLTQLWITHHHWDHTQGLEQIKAVTGCTVIGPEENSKTIAGLDAWLKDGDTFEFAGRKVHIIATPGHTTDMINFHLPEEGPGGIVFTGDTLFTLGCGRIFEGTPQMMWDSLRKLMALPPQTVVYSAHEYTLANAKFALSVDPGNTLLQARAKSFEAMRARGEATVPTTMAEELQTNPFLRASDPDIRKLLAMETAGDAEVFTEIRRRKDSF